MIDALIVFLKLVGWGFGGFIVLIVVFFLWVMHMARMEVEHELKKAKERLAFQMVLLAKKNKVLEDLKEYLEEVARSPGLTDSERSTVRGYAKRAEQAANTPSSVYGLQE